MFELTVIFGPDKGKVFSSSADEATIGRDESIEMTLGDHSTSRKHARIFKRGRCFEIEDLKSGNGTILNAERITRPTQLHTGDLISVGKDTIRFHQKEDGVPLAEQTDYLMTATITMRDLQRELAAQRGETIPDWDPSARAQQDMAAIFRSGQSLAGLQSGDELYPRIIEVVLAELPRADRCSLILSEGVGQEPSVQITQARKNTIGIADTMYKTSLAHTALAQQQAMLIRDPGTDTRLAEADTVINKNIRSAIFVPIQTLGGIRGVLYADCVTDSDGFNEPDLKLLSVISLQAAAAIDNIRLFEKLHEEKAALASANASIKLAQQRLVQSEKLAGVGELAAGIVHDIRNPIQLILGHAQFLQSILRDTEPAALDKAELTEGLMEIERGVGHVNEVVSQLLAFARQSKPELRTTRLNDVALDTMRFLQPETNKNHVKVLSQFNPLMPPVLADPTQLKQVIVNIVINAVQAMPQGGTLTVTTALLKEENRDMVSLALADTGAGMTPDQLGKIFDPFFTTKTHSTTSTGGMGLGLSVSYGIIEAHGGRILVDSEPGRGSCFTILLPAHNTPVTTQPDDPRATFHG